MRGSVLWTLLALLTTGAGVAAEDTLSPAAYYRLWQQAVEQTRSGAWTEAAATVEKLAAANPDDAQLGYWRGYSLYRAGRGAEALPIGIAALEAGFGSEDRSARLIAQAYAAAGDAESALSWLERSLAAGLENRPGLKTDDAFAGLRSDPRFRRLAGFAPQRALDREQGWRLDLDHFVSEVRRLHAAPSGIGEGPELDVRVEALKARVGEMTNVQVAVELQKIVAWLGDGHTVLYPFPTERVPFEYLPLKLYFFADGLFVVESAEEAYSGLVGQRVVAIGGKSTATLVSDLAPYVSRDNDQGILWVGPRYLTVTAMLQAMGYADALDRARFTVVSARGNREEVEVRTGRRIGRPKLGPPAGTPAGSAPLWLRDVGNNYWHRRLPGLDALYVQLNQVRDKEEQSIADYARVLKSALTEGGATHLLLDLRHNNGGNNFLIWPLIRLLAYHEMSSEDHQVFVITGRNTFSACQNFINFIDRALDRAVFVGERSSSKPNFTGEDTDVELPWSGLRMSISSRYWQDSFPGDRRPYISMAMPVPLTSQDYFGNRDPVLESLRELLATPSE